MLDTGICMKNNKEYDWDEVLSAAARLQGHVREAVLVGGTASALFAGHRTSYDADHVIPNLRQNFDEILSDLESVSGWTTARIKPPVLILGSLDGVETGVRQLIRSEPLETAEIYAKGQKIVVPTEKEILRIKAALILKRNATRDYLDFAALSKHLEGTQTAQALQRFDELYPQKNGASALQQLYIQLATHSPYDLNETNFSKYKNLSEDWKKWDTVVAQCVQVACDILDHYPIALSQQRDHAHLLDTATVYTDALKTYTQAKEAQAQRIESRLEKAVAVQQAVVAESRAHRPGVVSSLWRGKAWEQRHQAQATRLQVLERRLEQVRGIRADMGGKRLAELARKKLQHDKRELVAKHDAEERIRRERQAEDAIQKNALRQAKERSQTQSRGRRQGIER